MPISIIAAVAENGVIGRGGELPWRLADDLRRFRELTMGHTIVMGRKTWESIARPLAGRRMVVISRQAGYQAEGVEVVANLEDALAAAKSAGDEEVFVIGGAEIYRLALPRADRLYLTNVRAEIDGDTAFPPVDLSAWKCIASEQHEADEKNDYPYVFNIYERPGEED